MTEAVLVLDSAGNCVDVVPTRASGASRQLPEDDGSLVDAIRNALETRQPVPFEHCCKMGDESYHVAGTLSALSADRVLFVARDVTEERRCQDSLRGSERHFRRLIESSPLAMAVVSAEGKGLYVNPKFTELLGYTLKDVPTLDDWWLKVFPDSTYRQLAMAVGLRRLAEASRSGSGMRPVEAIVRCKDGSHRQIEFHSAPFDGSTLGILVDLTERRRTEAALRESEERYRRFVQLSAEGVWRFDAVPPVPTSLGEEEQARLMLERGHLAECNDAYARQHGYQRSSDMIGKRLRDILYGTPEQQLAIIRQFVRANYRVIDLETVGTDREGHPRSYLNNVVGIVQNGKIPWGWGTQRDITERKKTEQELQHKTENMKRLLDLAPLSIVVVRHADGNVLYLNPTFTEVFGYALEDIPNIAIFWRKVFPETEYRRRTAAEWRRRLAEAAERGTGLTPMTARFTCKDGSTRYVESHAMPMEGHTLTIHVDLTERRRAEAALLESEERYRRFVQITAEGVLRVDVQPPVPTEFDPHEQAKLLLERATVGECNNAYARQRGFDRAEDVIGRKVADIVDGDTEEKRRIALRFVSSGYRIVDLETSVVHRDGSTSWYLNNVMGVRNERGLIGGWGTQRDITARRASDQALRHAHCELERRVAERTAELSAANERLRELDRMKSQFLAMMSHELRTPLNSIIGFTGILRQGLAGPVNEEQTKQLGITYQSALHLLSLINDLLDLSRLEAGKMRPEHLPFDFSDVVTEALANVTAMASCKGLRLVSDVPAALLMEGDRKRTLQVLLNLVDNAVKFTPAGEVKVSATLVDGTLRTTVSDTGIGIHREHIGMLFEAFRQLDGTSRRVYEGTGLGLYLCRKLLTMMGGEIWAESEFGKGSRFTFTLPREIVS